MRIKTYIAAARDKRVPTRLGVNSYGNRKENRDQESGNEGEDKEKATQLEATQITRTISQAKEKYRKVI